MTPETVGRALLVLLRVSGFIVAAPPFAGRDVPAPVKGGLAFLTTLLLIPWAGSAPLPSDGVGWTLAALGEVGAGLALAGFWSLFFAGMQTAGHLIGTQVGIGWGGIFDPQFGESTETFSQVQRVLGVLLFFAVDGHLRLWEVLAHGFEWAPAGRVCFSPEVAGHWSRAFGDLLLSGVKLAAPVGAALWLLTFVIGLLGRAAPQMNLMAVDFPVRILAGLFILIASLPHAVAITERLLAVHLQRVGVFARALGG